MDQLPSFGTGISESLMPTFKLYSELQNKNRAAIESTRREEHEYGTEIRQKLDLYTPHSVTDDTPILVFVYGGGFVRGDKRLITPAGEMLMYANIGYYFTSRGFITVVPDYRRTGEGAHFPSGGEDIAATIAWLRKTYSHGSHKLYIMGNSAGAVHTSTWLLEPKFAESRKYADSGSLILQSATLVAMPAHFQAADESRSDVLRAYYGDKVAQNCPFGLLERAVAPNVPVLVVTGTLDPEDEIIQPSDDFVQRWQSQLGGAGLTVKVLEGHNHFSTVSALGTGNEKEESLGTAWLKWVGH